MIASEVASPGIPVSKQERDAYAHHEYKELLKGLQVAVEREEVTKHKIDAINMKFESWRTKEATRRTEINFMK